MEGRREPQSTQVGVLKDQRISALPNPDNRRTAHACSNFLRIAQRRPTRVQDIKTRSLQGARQETSPPGLKRLKLVPLPERKLSKRAREHPRIKTLSTRTGRGARNKCWSPRIRRNTNVPSWAVQWGISPRADNRPIQTSAQSGATASRPHDIHIQRKEAQTGGAALRPQGLAAKKLEHQDRPNCSNHMFSAFSAAIAVFFSFWSVSQSVSQPFAVLLKN